MLIVSVLTAVTIIVFAVMVVMADPTDGHVSCARFKAHLLV